MSAEPYNRRASDKRAFDIEAMIAEENDPKQRAFLIVMNSINNSLVANTATTREVNEKLDTHLTNFENRTAIEDAMLNKGRGMWKVTVWVLGAVQTVAVALALQAQVKFSEMNDVITAGQKVDIRIEARLANLEARK